MADASGPAPASAVGAAPAATPPSPLPPPEQRSTMLERFGLLARLLVRLLFRHVQLRPDAIEHIRGLAARGTVVYVMRYRSTLDYLLVNTVLLRAGLPLARFAPDVSTVWFRPLGDFLRWTFRERRRAAPAVHAACAALVACGTPVVLFMRSLAVAGRRRRALSAARLGPQYLRDVVHAAEATDRPVFLVPIAIFRGKGFRRKESRFATLLYSVQEAPGEAKRFFTYLWNAEETQVTVGQEIRLDTFVADHARENEERLVRRLARALQIFLYREERLVWGPTLLPRRQVRRQVLRDPELARLVRRIAAERGVPRRKVWREARGYFDGMAASYNGLYFGILEAVFNRVWRRVFAGLEILGLENVIECVKQHPVVLVPCHRSHFDYLILSYIFHMNYLSPPHIAAGDNLSFWPLGPLFRGAGAFFIKRSFDDNELYKMVFRKYLAFLIREGYTQEFFIEGGRTRTGKILTPKLGMLSALVNAFVQGARRDLFFVPISIHYGRIPEEEAYRREVAGEEKEPESLGALARAARAVWRKRYGTAYVSFGEPISLAEALGPLRDRFHAGQGDPPVEEEKRRFIQRLGFRLLRDVNGAAVAGATAISATALLGAPRAACRLADFLASAHALVGILRRSGVRLTASLERNEATNFRESLAWLESGGHVERLTDSGGLVLYVPAEKRLNLDFYKNNTIHFFLLPSLVTRALLAEVPLTALRQHVAWWLDLYRWEFPLPERDALADEIGRWVDYYRHVGALEGDAAVPEHPVVRATAGILENFREAYLTAARTIAAHEDWPIGQPALVQRMRRQFRTSLLLGDVLKPEGNSTVTFDNALSRLAELSHVTLVRRSRRERVVDRGPAFDRLPDLIRHFR
ncbi:MAG TPA: 1-acyl-sn-glycerol-3-phosphate acyltransferase [Candidatus Binatia bacterium]|nr:1-acyl-sn-glycerol-3-phosphate acyltransferase [Candidatus Binatia bacterium]